MKFRWRLFGSGKKKAEQVGGKIVNCELHVSAGPARLEEVFFDSQVWLDSDVEDFYSVNGDFTPSCGNTPIHPSVARTPERTSANVHHDIVPELLESPADNRKRLSDLFGDEQTNRVTEESYNKTILIQKCEPLLGNTESQKSMPGSPYTYATNSICSSTERTPTKSLKNPKYRSGCSSPCCIPSLARSLSFGQKKKRFVPAQL